MQWVNFLYLNRGWNWGYNARGEVVKSTHADDNALNQYTAIDAGSPVNPVYDDDGNLLEDKGVNLRGVALEYTWDGENRLIEVRRASDDALVASYAYDFMGRRVRKTTTSAAPQGVGDMAYIYDEWNPVAQYDLTGSLTAAPAKRFVWGTDLSGSPQGAGGVGGVGGVGGLLYVIHGGDAYAPTYDGNGNISEYVDGDGEVVAHYEYDPFGKLVASTGDWEDFSHRFSTKPQDEETGFLYYGYRYYDPQTGRWPSRDPIEEEGGLNLYEFVQNDGINRVDFLGLCGTCPSGKRIQKIEDDEKCTHKYRTDKQKGIPTSNGCGAEGGQGFPNTVLGANFKPACDTHDKCYGTCGVSRKHCDERFKTMFYNACKASYNPQNCRYAANQYYRGVRLAGDKPYQTAQDKYCEWKKCCQKRQRGRRS